MQIRNDTDNTSATGGKTMKKIMVILIIISTLIIAGVLYGTSSLNVDEEAALSLEQAYMAQYPKTMPDIMFDPIPTNIPF
jgi:flagellar basal body-associated protein FliL